MTGAAPRAREPAPPACLPGPGGPELVARGVALAGLRPGARVLDVGCGEARDVAHLRCALGLAVVGLDRAPRARPGGAVPLLRAEAARLPVATGAVDGVLLACVLSTVEEPAPVLGECARVLAPGGKLVVADLYARAPDAGPAPERRSCGLRLRSAAALRALLERHGLRAACCEDHSDCLRAYLFRLLMDADRTAQRAPGGLLAGDGGCSPDVRRLRPGYLLLVAERLAPG